VEDNAVDKLVALIVICIAVILSLAITFGISRGRASDALEAEMHTQCLKLYKPYECNELPRI
jgi:hypothetical protein